MADALSFPPAVSQAAKRVVTAEFGELKEVPEAVFQRFIIELAVLTVTIVALAVARLLLRTRGAPAVAHRA